MKIKKLFTKNKLIFVFGFIIGFIVAAHWDFGLHFVQKVSPLYDKGVKMSSERVMRDLQQTGSAIKDKIEKEIK